MFRKLSQTSPLLPGAAETPLVPFTIPQRDLFTELSSLHDAIERCPAYQTSIKVAHRKGEWDQREEVQLKRTFTKPHDTSSVGGSQRSKGALQPLKEWQEENAELLRLLEVSVAPAAASASEPSSLSEEKAPILSDHLPGGIASELARLLRPICAHPVPLIIHFIIRHIIPRRHTAAFHFLVTEVLRSSYAATLQQWQESATTAAADLMEGYIQLLFECASKNWKQGVMMCVQIDDGDLPTIGININVRSLSNANGGGIVLHVAATSFHAQLMAFLICNGADPLAINAFERTALFPLRQLYPATTASLQLGNGTNLGSESTTVAEEPVNHAVSYMAQYYNSPRLADVLLRVHADGAASPSEFYAHRLALCSQSEVFRVMLEGDLSRKTTPSSSASTISSAPKWVSGLEEDTTDEAAGVPSLLIADVPDVIAFGLFLRYFYTGSIIFTNDNLHLAAGVLQLATRFLVEPLRQWLATHLGGKDRSTECGIVVRTRGLHSVPHPQTPCRAIRRESLCRDIRSGHTAAPELHCAPASSTQLLNSRIGRNGCGSWKDSRQGETATDPMTGHGWITDW